MLNSATIRISERCGCMPWLTLILTVTVAVAQTDHACPHVMHSSKLLRLLTGVGDTQFTAHSLRISAAHSRVHSDWRVQPYLNNFLNETPLYGSFASTNKYD